MQRAIETTTTTRGWECDNNKNTETYNEDANMEGENDDSMEEENDEALQQLKSIQIFKPRWAERKVHSPTT